MTLRIPFVLAAAVAAATALPASTAAQSAFEGVITFESDAGPQGQQTIKYSVKGRKVRMDMSAMGMPVYSISDLDTKTYDMVMPQRKMYLENSVPDAQAKADSVMQNSKIDWTGKKETIAGHECEHANITDPTGTVVDACLAKDLGSFMGMGGPGGRRGRGRRGGGAAGWAEHLGNVFPLKVVRDGRVEMLVTSIEKKSLDDSLFTVPSGYQKMGMPGGRGGRGGRGGSGGL